MLSSIHKRKEQGFTLIEVLIVLAIAGLILLIVFLAVPALQRNQRNTARKQDASRIGGAATDFVSNNDGTLPATTTDLGTILSSAGKLGQYGTLTKVAGAPTAKNSIGIEDGSSAAKGPLTVADTLDLVTGATCDVGGASKAGSSRQMALLYTIENSSGVTALCLSVN